MAKELYWIVIGRKLMFLFDALIFLSFDSDFLKILFCRQELFTINIDIDILSVNAQYWGS